MTANPVLDAAATAARLPYPALVDELRRLLADAEVEIPPRLVQALPGGGSLFVMPGRDAQVAMTKLITFTPANAGTPRPAIQGDVVVFDIASGQRKLVLDGPTVTARRTAAVSALAALELVPAREGPMLVVGAGAQGFAHVEAFAACLGVEEFRIASRSAASAQALASHVQQLGLRARVADDVDAQPGEYSFIVTCTPAREVVLRASPRDDAFVAAVGAFTPAMAELAPQLCRHFALHGRIVVDTPEAVHEAGDLLQAGLDVTHFATLRDVVLGTARSKAGPVLFKSCGWAGWDLAAARCALRQPG